MISIKKLVCILISLIIIFEFSGCESKQRMEKDFQKYAENKYGVKFKVKSSSKGYCKWIDAIKDDECILYPQNDKTKLFNIHRPYNFISNHYIYEDNYTGIILKPLIYERLKGIIGSDFSNFKYSVDVISYSKAKQFNMQDKLDTILLKQNDTEIDLNVLVNYGDKLDKNKMANSVYQFMRKIASSNLIKKKNYITSVNAEFYFVNAGVFDKLSPKHFDDNDYHIDDSTSSEISIGIYNDTVEAILNNFKSVKNKK